ncbi:MAG: hydrogenase expression/formation protein HypE [Candidatus Eremiobacteraeota bacterium]|nr:hydrogenase expression/formation protein HypE [Candidatus Eremiobacteraeota bacterium]
METLKRLPAKLRFNDPQIEMAHGAGGKLSRRLVEGLIVPILRNPVLESLSDSAVFDFGNARMATTADGYVVKPLQFNGGSIGELAVNGTVNDLAVSGARPLGLMATFILEAGLASSVLRSEIEAMAQAAARAGTAVYGGDTKVVEHGMADGMYVSTFGFGQVDSRARLDSASVRPGDRILLSGPIGDHGITILLARGELELEADLRSDTRPITAFIMAMLDVAAEGLRWMRDPTRGGVATVLNELVRDANVGAVIYEDAIPLRDEVRGACEILGLDPLHIANEGQFIAILAPEYAQIALEAVRSTDGGEKAVLIGEIHEEPLRTVICETGFGGTRVVDMLIGDPLPRIC